MDQEVGAGRVLGGLVLAVLVACTTRPPSVSGSPTIDPVSRGGVLRVALAGEVTSLDPWVASDLSSLVVLRQVFETLVDLEPGGYGIVPRLAESWTPSTDALTWTVQLRTGVRFHDGSAFDARAVVANFARARALGGAGTSALQAEVTAADAGKVVFRLRDRDASFLATLASPSFGMVSPACLALGPAWAAPGSRCAAGTGPFRVQPGDRPASEGVALVRNPSYWEQDADGRPLPYLDGLTFLPIDDGAARAAALRSAAADVALDVGAGGARALRADPKLALVRRPAFDTSFIGFGPALARGSVAIRRAIAMAIDSGAIVQTVYGGDARAATQLVPPGVLGHDDTIAQFVPNDVPAAKRLLAESGAALPSTVDLWYPRVAGAAIPDPRRLAEAVSADLAKIGLVAVPRAEDRASLVTAARAGTLALWIGTRAPIRADPDDFLTDVSEDPVVRELLRRARAETDPVRRAELYKQVTKLCRRDVTRIPLFHANVSHGVSGKVRGLVAQPAVGESFGAVWIGR